ncbi:hepatopoietin HPO1 [Histoplasma capsulatum G186AR]|uniref:Sulfhydryl oxidase n=2 Tax=Ajellomyces capsulatus TaxID=5037 RepID=C0NAX1_AJECG|nr:hepatopoietin HPO1 [Histoplasma capsulatum G186AR]EEH10812.1 hepatopoietin HPO1 [Histoplasma capsulatum G186AR]KAG5288692.1 hepatopoietin HPO1 [Histoplasma capsulatum]QSS71268.1 hepatopoietin HPO1 [Histoplasma capsulatum G186AR]
MAEILTEQLDALRDENRHPKKSRHSATEDGKQEDGSQGKAKLPKGMVLGKDGKPCRTCVSISDWRALMKSKSPTTTITTPASSSATTTTATTTAAQNQAASLPPDCPPDVEALGRSTWALLHSMTATYPTTATPQQQNDMRSFLALFGKLYPCWVCADDFRAWMNEPSGANRPRLKTRAEFGNWMCEAHNEVNRKLGKEVFDCAKWEERWRTGWKDGRCD